MANNPLPPTSAAPTALGGAPAAVNGPPRMQGITASKNLGLFTNPAVSAQFDKLNGLIANGTGLTKSQLNNYNALNTRQNQLSLQKDKAANKAATTAYNTAQQTAPARALGGYLSPSNNYNWNSFSNEAGLPAGTSQWDLLKPYTQGQYGTDTNRPNWNMGQDLSTPDAANFKSLYGYDIGNALAPVTADQIMSNDPGYQFRMDQGQQALERSAAARGGVLGGGQLKALQQYGQGFASNEYQNAWNRDQQVKQNAINQYNNWFNQTMGVQNRDLQNYYSMAGLNMTQNDRVLGQYNNDFNISNSQRNQYGNYLLGMTNMGAGAAANTASSLVGANTNMADQYTGAGSAAAQATTNGAMGVSSAINSGLNNVAGLAAMYPSMATSSSPTSIPFSSTALGPMASAPAAVTTAPYKGY